MSKPDTVQAWYGGRLVTARLTGLDHKGRPYAGGYRQATVGRGRNYRVGRLAWLAGGWRFEARKDDLPTEQK